MPAAGKKGADKTVSQESQPDNTESDLDKAIQKRFRMEEGELKVVGSDSRKRWIIALLVILVIVSAVSLVSFLKPEKKATENQSTQHVIENKTPAVTYVKLNISFANITSKSEEYNYKMVTLTGHLLLRRQEGSSMGDYMTSISDDYGNAIQLNNVNQDMYVLFTKDIPTKQLYNVTGTFKTGFFGPIISVTGITPTERPQVPAG